MKNESAETSHTGKHERESLALMQFEQRLHSRLWVALLHDALAHEDGAAASCSKMAVE
jgi:hypothetical protein